MARINLLPPEYRAVRTINIKKTLYTAGVIALAALCLFLYAEFSRNYSEQKNELARIEGLIEKEQPVLAGVYSEKKLRQDLDQVSLFIQGLDHNRVVWSRLAAEIKGKTPDRVELIEIVTGAEDSFVIRGESPAFYPVAEFYLDLKDSPHLSVLSMQNLTKELTSDYDPVVKFELTGRLRKGGAQ